MEGGTEGGEGQQRGPLIPLFPSQNKLSNEELQTRARNGYVLPEEYFTHIDGCLMATWLSQTLFSTCVRQNRLVLDVNGWSVRTATSTATPRPPTPTSTTAAPSLSAGPSWPAPPAQKLSRRSSLTGMRLARLGNLERKDLSRVAADQRRKIREKMKLVSLARLWRLNFVWRWSPEPRTCEAACTFGTSKGQRGGVVQSAQPCDLYFECNADIKLTLNVVMTP